MNVINESLADVPMTAHGARMIGRKIFAEDAPQLFVVLVTSQTPYQKFVGWYTMLTLPANSVVVKDLTYIGTQPELVAALPYLLPVVEQAILEEAKSPIDEKPVVDFQTRIEFSGQFLR